MGDMPPKRTPGEIWKQIVDEARDDEEIREDRLDEPRAARQGAEGRGVRPRRRAGRRGCVPPEAGAQRRRAASEAAGGAGPRPLSAPAAATASRGRVARGGDRRCGRRRRDRVRAHPPGRAARPFAPGPVVGARARAFAGGPHRRVDLRQRAYDDCAAQRWTECLAGLEGAKKLDPAGDRSSEVQLARQQAEHQLAVDGGPEGDKPHPR